MNSCISIVSLPVVLIDYFIANKDIRCYKTRSSNDLHLFLVTASCIHLKANRLWNELAENLKQLKITTVFKTLCGVVPTNSNFKREVNLWAL